MLDWLKNIHTSEGIAQLIGSGGLVILSSIIFAETGLLLGFFLPGDSLLITAGVLANPVNPNHLPSLNVMIMNIILIIAAIFGDQVGYYLGKKSGDAMWQKTDGRFYKKKYLIEAHEFYENYGSISITGARYVPILRTFVPFVAGMARMSYKKFVFWNIFGGIIWVTSMVWIGYFLGQTQFANRLDKVIVIVLLISFTPLFYGFIKNYKFRKRN